MNRNLRIFVQNSRYFVGISFNILVSFCLVPKADRISLSDLILASLKVTRLVESWLSLVSGGLVSLFPYIFISYIPLTRLNKNLSTPQNITAQWEILCLRWVAENASFESFGKNIYSWATNKWIYQREIYVLKRGLPSCHTFNKHDRTRIKIVF